MPFLVSIDFHHAPRFEHPDFDAALTEAVRLSKDPKFKHANIRILEEVAVIPRGGVTTRQAKISITKPGTAVRLDTLLDLGLLDSLSKDRA